jgi:hypothetical protein
MKGGQKEKRPFKIRKTVLVCNPRDFISAVIFVTEVASFILVRVGLSVLKIRKGIVSINSQALASSFTSSPSVKDYASWRFTTLSYSCATNMPFGTFGMNPWMRDQATTGPLP